MCTVETEADINRKQLKNCIRRGESLKKAMQRHLEEFKKTGGNFDESPVHYIIDAFSIWLNDAFNIIRDFNLETFCVLHRDAVEKMKGIENIMQFLEQKKKPGVKQKCTFYECVGLLNSIDDVEDYFSNAQECKTYFQN